MNRRRFLEALAGIPVPGLLVKVPEAKEYREIITLDHYSHQTDCWDVDSTEAVLGAAYAELQSGAEVHGPYELRVGTADGQGLGDEIVTFKSSDWEPTADGFTDTDTYGIFVKKTGRGKSL